VRLLIASLCLALTANAQLISPVPDQVSPTVHDRQDMQVPDRIQLSGWVGQRILGSEANRLAKLDVDRLLEGYRKRPGRQSWDGEHIGKWLHAATLAWVNTGDPGLREKLDYAVAELMKCQMADGYLGTYVEKNRWRSWDVWAHKYNLIGLTTYVRYTGNRAPLETCRRMADLLCATFGEGPGQRDIIKSGPQVGMAPTSVLEPMVQLYRLTGEPRYLDFCAYILRAWEQPEGPRILSILLTAKRVDKIANGKSYEMLSCLTGALEYYRLVGDPKILEACLNAWQDIVDHRLYLTGAASYWEVFHDDFDLPNVNNVGETCVTVTWIQFNAQLLRLTGEARFANQLEHVVLNQLFGAQRCDGSSWGYYVQMEGRKPYSTNLDGHCCLSSGPRGVALIPTFALATDGDGAVVNLYSPGTAQLCLRDQTRVTLKLATQFPAEDHVRIAVEPSEERMFTIKFRLPTWCLRPALTVNGRKIPVLRGADGYAALRRTWRKGDEVLVHLPMQAGLVVGDHSNKGKVALTYGPLVLAADEELLNPDGPTEKSSPPMTINAVAVAGPKLRQLHFNPEPAPEKFKTWPGAQLFRINAVSRKVAGSPQPIPLIPFADAGGTGSRYKVWLPLPRSLYAGNLFLDAKESRSRPGNLEGSITDEDVLTAVDTYDGKKADEDWFAVQLARPVSVKRVVFAHGRTFHDGGWFDAAGGKPRIEVQRTADGPWEKIADLTEYPKTTATNSEEMDGSESVSCILPKPVRAWGLRVIGKPACGDNPQQAFSSCAELQAFEE